MKSNFKVLKLNRSYFPIGVVEWQRTVTDIFSGAVKPARVRMEGDKISEFVVYNSLEEWLSLTPREEDNFVNSAHMSFIVPRIVICTNYDRVPYRKIIFPTKRNIWERDDYTCGYTGRKLTKAQLSIDHILPSSRGGLNTWENLITCDRQLNSDKSDNLPEECNPPLKLRWKPKQPKNGLVFDIFDTAWETFIS